MDISKVIFSDHFKRQFAAKGFKVEDLKSCLESPEKITRVTRYPGQQRYCGSGLAVVMDGNRAITVYLDGVITPLRKDQMKDDAALNSKRLSQING